MIKWFDSATMPTLKKLNGVKGDLVKVLNETLVFGTATQVITSISYESGECRLNLATGHGFIKNSVVRIGASTQSVINNKEFVVKTAYSTYIIISVDSLVVDEQGVTIKYPPLGFDQHFAATDKACYRSPDPRYPAYLRIDETSGVIATATHAKVATAEICENMTDFDTATWQSPYDPNYPDQNRKTITRSNGWYKWYHATVNTGKSDNTVTPVGERRYVVIGDNTQFWIIIYPYLGADAKYGCVYGMPLANYYHTKKQVLIASNSFGPNDTVKNKPHYTFFNAYAKGGIAPFREPLSIAASSALAATTQGDSDVTMFAANITPLYDVIINNPIFILDSFKVAAEFVGVTLSQKVLAGGRILSTTGNKKMVVDVGQPYSLIFDLE